MAFNAGAVRAELDLNVNSFVGALKQATGALRKVEKQSKQNVSSFEKFRRGVGLLRDAIIILPAAFRAIQAPIRGVVNLLKEASDSASEFQVTVQKLTTAAALAGQTGIKRLVDNMKDFADEVQFATGVSNTLTLQIAQTGLVLGVQKDQLNAATQAVIDYAAATGRNALESAKQIFRTLSGLTGEVGENVPQVRALTQEMLKNGAAIKLIGTIFGGTAESIKNTTAGLALAFDSSLSDLHRSIGDALNPVKDVFLKLGSETFQRLTKLVNDNQEVLTRAFEKIGVLALGGLKSVFDAGLDFNVFLTKVSAFGTQLAAALQVPFLSLKAALGEVAAQIDALIARALTAATDLPLVGSAFEGIAKSARESAEATRKLADAAAEARDNNEAAGVAAAAAVIEAENQAVAIRSGAESAGLLGDAYIAIGDLIGKANEKLKEHVSQTDAVIISSSNYAAQLTERLTKLREMTGILPPLIGKEAELASRAREAADATADMAESASDAADEFGRAAGNVSGISSAAGTAGGGGPADGFGRREGGRAGFDLTTFEGARSAIAAAQAAQRQSVGGLFSRQARRSANIVEQQIRQVAEGLAEQAISDFTSGILNELNRAGITDATQRSALVAQRIAEAQRLGLLPDTGTLSANSLARL